MLVGRSGAFNETLVKFNRSQRRWPRAALALVLTVASGTAAAGPSPERNPAYTGPRGSEQPVSRLLVQLADAEVLAASSVADADSAVPSQAEAVAAATRMRRRLEDVARRRDIPARGFRQIAPRLGLIELEQPLDGDALAETLRRLESDASVAAVEIDRPKYRHLQSNDPFAGAQWYLADLQPAALRTQAAWDLTTGSSGVVVAVIDTGVLYEHPDLRRASSAGRLLPGYDFVSADPDGRHLRANDGDGYDADPSDPGDWVSASDRTQSVFRGCATGASSWHGTRVSGLIAALTDNAVGVAGMTWKTWILPVRVLGKCSGYDSDILAAMRWAGGLPVDGVPANPYPAQIINMSLGSGEECRSPYAQVIDELAARGVLVVASAGNEGGPVATPASCPGVVAVAGVRHAGTKVGYSSLGREVTLAAPAGNCVNVGANQPCLYSIDTTSNAGTTTPGTHVYTDQIDFNVGTSFSAPLAAGVAALMRGSHNRLPPSLLLARLQESSRPFPASSDPTVPTCHVPTGSTDVQVAECVCTSETCGAGLLDADAAVRNALRPVAAPRASGAIAAGQVVVLDGAASVAACGRSVVRYAWTIVSGTGAIADADRMTASITAPAAGSTVVRLIVEDDRGASDSAELEITPDSAIAYSAAPLPGTSCPTDISIAQVPGDGAGTGGGTGAGGGTGGSGGGSNAGSGNGGGGSIDPNWIVLLLVATRRLRARARESTRGSIG